MMSVYLKFTHRVGKKKRNYRKMGENTPGENTRKQIPNFYQHSMRTCCKKITHHEGPGDRGGL